MSLTTIINNMILDAPPGEIKDVINDLTKIVDKDIKSEIDEAVENYNLNEFTAVQLPGQDSKTIISKYNKSGSKFIDYENQKLFNINSSSQPIDIEEYEFTYSSQCTKILKSLTNYLAEHYPSEYAYQLIPTENEIVIVVLGWKYNPSNFYNGLWKSVYTIDDSNNKLTGSITLDIHYYEDGNVRFTNKHDINETLDLDNVITQIKDLENDLEKQVNQSFKDLNDTTFKNLRRLLPVTRSKINWGKAIGNYRLGQDVAGGREMK